MKAIKRYLLLSLLFAALFGGFTVLVCTVDVAPVGPLGSAVGCAAWNLDAWNTLGTSEAWYKVSEMLGMVALLTMAGFAVLGGVQLLRRKSFRRVDGSLYAMAALYVVLLVAYAAFEVVVINHRPVLTEGALEASYPSSHTMLAVTVMSATAVELFSRVRSNRFFCILLPVLCCAVAALTVVSRTLSGVHWITDIVGALLLSATLLMLYLALRAWLQSKLPVTGDGK